MMKAYEPSFNKCWLVGQVYLYLPIPPSLLDYCKENPRHYVISSVNRSVCITQRFRLCSCHYHTLKINHLNII